MNAQRGSTEEQSLADLARRLLAADTGGWTPDGVNALADGLGWARGGTADRPVLITGRSGRTSDGAPLLFDVACGDRLSIGCFAPDGVDAASLGWGTVAEHPATASVWRDDDPGWRVDAGGPRSQGQRPRGDARGDGARAAGVSEPAGLIVGGEAEYVDGYHVRYYGLGLPTG